VRNNPHLGGPSTAKLVCFVVPLQGLDAALRVGVPAGAIMELVGPAGVGKSQFCYSLALQVQQKAHSCSAHLMCRDCQPAAGTSPTVLYQPLLGSPSFLLKALSLSAAEVAPFACRQSIIILGIVCEGPNGTLPRHPSM